MNSEVTQNSIQKQLYLWSVFQISIASYLAGPLVGFYFLGNNFKEMGFRDDAKKCYLAGIGFTALLSCILYFISENISNRIPPFYISIIISSIVLSFTHYKQKSLIDEKMSQGAKRFSGWWCILMMFSFIIIQVPLHLFFAFLFAIIN